MTNPNLSVAETVDHLFRHEYGKLVAVLTNVFGSHNLELAEDVVQDTLLKALDHWKIHGMPSNPGGWLLVVARNKAIDIIRRQKREKIFANEISYLLQSEYTLSSTLNELINEQQISDSMLRMMFTCCHPALSTESQVTLTLKTLCGFSVNEIARAFLTAPDTIEKRLYRARLYFRENNISFEIPGENELDQRIENVLLSIYLLFNEGYNSMQTETLIRMDLLDESLRLTQLLAQHPLTRSPRVFALQSLMCFTNARNAARLDGNGNILLLQNQDRSLWDKALIARGTELLELSARGNDFSSFHLEAAIAYEHCTAADFAGTNWKQILRYYDLLEKIQPNPVVSLNRVIVIDQYAGPETALDALERMDHPETLKNYYLFYAVRAELYQKLNRKEESIKNFERAISLTGSPAEKRLMQEKLNRLLKEENV